VQVTEPDVRLPVRRPELAPALVVLGDSLLHVRVGGCLAGIDALYEVRAELAPLLHELISAGLRQAGDPPFALLDVRGDLVAVPLDELSFVAGLLVGVEVLEQLLGSHAFTSLQLPAARGHRRRGPADPV